MAGRCPLHGLQEGRSVGGIHRRVCGRGFSEGSTEVLDLLGLLHLLDLLHLLPALS